MPSIINALTASGGGVAITGDATGNLALQTAGNTAVTINTSQQVGIGTTTPSRQLQVESSAAENAVFIKNTNATTGTNYGLLVAGGSNASDYSAVFKDKAETDLMKITGNGLLQFNSGYGSVATAYGCRAWVSFNGTGTVAIQASGNVTSITDNGTGNYTVNFTSAMPDANYAAFLGNGGGYNDIGSGTKTASAVQVYTYNFGNPPGSADRTPVSVAVFR